MKTKRSSVLGGIAIVSSLAIVAKFSGLLREGVIANSFGTTSQMDIYSIVSIYPGAIMEIIASSAATVFLPIFVKNLKLYGEGFASHKFSQFLNQYIIFSFILYALIYYFVPSFAIFISRRIPDSNIADIILYSRLLFFTIITNGIVRLMITALNGMRNFGWLQKTQILLNFITIFSVLFLSPYIGIMALIGAVIFNSVFQVVVLSFVFYKNNLKYKFEVNVTDKELVGAWKSVIPVFLGAETYLLGLTIDRTVGMMLGEEGITSALNYSGSLYGMLNSIIAVPIITVLFTKLSEIFADKGLDGLIVGISEIASIMYILIIPVALFLFVNATDFVTVILQRGAFDENSTELTSSAFMFYALACPLLAMRELLCRVYVIIGKKKELVWVGVIFLLSNTCFSMGLSQFFGVSGVALGSMLASLVALVYIVFKLMKLSDTRFGVLSATLLKVCVSSCLSAIVSYVLCTNISIVYVRVTVSFVIFGFSYFILLWLFRCQELEMLRKKYLRK